MRILLDTHAFIWWFVLSERLSQAARQAIRDYGNDVLVSLISNESLFDHYGVRRLW